MASKYILLSSKKKFSDPLFKENPGFLALKDIKFNGKT